MRASRRIIHAASLTGMAVACLLLAPAETAWAQEPGQAAPADAPNGAHAPPDAEDGAPPRREREHDRARDAVREGQSLPLGNIIRELQRTGPGTNHGAG